jgi:hypothetical protein
MRFCYHINWTFDSCLDQGLQEQHKCMNSHIDSIHRLQDDTMCVQELSICNLFAIPPRKVNLWWGGRGVRAG